MRPLGKRGDRSPMGLRIACLPLCDGTLVEESAVREAVARHSAALKGGLDPAEGRVIVARPWRSVTCVKCGPIRVAVKEHRPNRLRAVVTTLGCPSIAARAMRGYRLLVSRGIAVAGVVAIAEEYRSGFFRRGFLLTRWLEDGEELRQFFRRVQPPASFDLEGADPWCATVRLIARHLARFHAAGLTMDDYHTPNLVMVPGPDGPVLVLVDYDTVRPLQPGWRDRLLNLYTVRRSLGRELPDPGRELFLDEYLSASGIALLARDRMLLTELCTPFVTSKQTPEYHQRFWRTHRSAFTGLR
jgi:hypothetical protein